MPRMNGFEFVARLRALPGCKGTIVIVISGHTAEACRARARELGIGPYLLKPADPDRVRALLDRLVVPVELRSSLDAPRRVRGRPVEQYAGAT
jgi:CheY-like chemotaxis protein